MLSVLLASGVLFREPAYVPLQSRLGGKMSCADEVFLYVLTVNSEHAN